MRYLSFYSTQRLASLIFALLLGFSLLVWAADDPVQPIRDAYDNGDFNQAEFLALKALQRPENLTSSQVIEVRKLLAFCYVALDDTASAMSEFMKVLEANPKLTLAPLYISPKIISVFEEAKRQYKLKPHTKEVQTPENICLNAAWHSLLIPGWGQFKKNQPNRGYIFMATQTAALGSWIGLMVMTENAHNDYLNETNPSQMNNKFDRYQTTLRVRNTVGIFALTVYVASFLDCLYGPEPRIQPTFSYQFDHATTPRIGLTYNF
jgi:hypothetical protein